MGYPLHDVLSHSGRTALFLLLFGIFLQHLLDLLEDLEGVGEVDVPCECHVPSAPRAFLRLWHLLLLFKAGLADDAVAAC